MTFTWKLNGNHDVSISSGKVVGVSGAEEVKQRILIALRHFYAEYFLDVTKGVPWYETILGSKDIKNAELIMRSTILDVPGVIGITSFSATFTNSSRKLSISVSAEVQAGENAEIINLHYSSEYFR